MISDFFVGDTIFHKSNSSVVWVIDGIEEDILICSIIKKENFEKVINRFQATSVEKIVDRPSIIVSQRKRNSNFW